MRITLNNDTTALLPGYITYAWIVAPTHQQKKFIKENIQTDDNHMIHPMERLPFCLI